MKGERIGLKRRETFIADCQYILAQQPQQPQQPQLQQHHQLKKTNYSDKEATLPRCAKLQTLIPLTSHSLQTVHHPIFTNSQEVMQERETLYTKEKNKEFKELRWLDISIPPIRVQKEDALLSISLAKQMFFYVLPVVRLYYNISFHEILHYLLLNHSR